MPYATRLSARRGSSSRYLFGISFPLFVLIGSVLGGALWRESRQSRSTPMVLGDTTTVYGPQQFNGSSGQGQTYVEQFTTTPAPGRVYWLHLVNGAPGGTNRASKVIIKLNGYEIVSQNEVTQAVATLDRPVAITAVDTIRVTVAGSGSPYVTLSILSTPDSSFDVFGPNSYAVTSGSSTTHSTSFARPAGAAAPYRVYVVNGATDGTLRATSASVTLNGTQIVTTSELTSAVGSLTKIVTLNASNTLGVTVNGSANRYITVRFTATDTTKPALTITSPPPNTFTRNSSITVNGTLSDQTATSVTVNGVAATVTNNTSYTAVVPLTVEGNNLITVVATDASGRHTDSTRTVIRDTQTPALAVLAPVDGAITRNATIVVNATATDASGVTVNTNGTPLTNGGSDNFSGSVALVQGSNVLTTTALDNAGNTASVVRTVIRDTLPPALTVDVPLDQTSTQSDSITVSGTVADLTAVGVTVNGTTAPIVSGAFNLKVALADGANSIQVIATDAATNQTIVTRTVTRQLVIPPDPATLASANNPSIATTVGGSTAFLYTGPNAIQTGVVPGTIAETRAGVFRGKVVDQAGAALSGAVVTVVDHPELGRTVTRNDGRYDLAVNAGGRLTLDFRKAGYLPSQRTMPIQWQEYADVDSVALIPLDSNVTALTFTQPIETARGSVVTDDDGTRQATLLFEQGTTATMVLPNGSTQPIASPHVRVTEYTVGALGNAAMPATLPPTSAYTYAAELTVDEAMSAGASEVRFSKPVAFYLDNFLDFPVGTPVPYGWYDRKAERWVPEPDGRVIKILSITSDLANLDIAGAGQPASQAALDSLGITTDERARLATLYSVGKTLWRTEHTHFTPGDWNWGWGVIAEAFTPVVDFFRNQEPKPKCGNSAAGSIIGCQSQSLGEALAVTGTPFNLYYDSERVPGRVANYRVQFPALTTVPRETVRSRLYLYRNEVPSHAIAVIYTLSVAGRYYDVMRPVSETNAPLTLIWDGRDAYNRIVYGKQRATVTIGFVYPSGTYRGIGGNGGAGGGGSFASAGSVALPTAQRQNTVILGQSWTTELGGWDTRGAGVAGWTLDAHHGYDPLGGMLYRGDGTERTVKALGAEIQLVPGTQGRFSTVGSLPFYDRAFPSDVAIGADGSVYIAYTDEGVVRRRRPDGQLVVHATLPTTGIAVAPNGDVYVSDRNGNRVRRVTPSGTISVVAGTGSAVSSGDGGLATAAGVRTPEGLAIGPDGSLYIAESNAQRVRRVGPDGIIRTFAGNGTSGVSGDGGPATNATLTNPMSVSVAPDGAVYIVSGTSFWNYDVVRRVGTDGIISTFAGRTFYQAGSTPAQQQQLVTVRRAVVAPNGTVLITTQGRVYQVDQNGNITNIAGQGTTCVSTPSTGYCLPSDGDGGRATQAYFKWAWGIAASSNGLIYVTDYSAHKLRVIRPALPGIGLDAILVASDDATEVYTFDRFGRHLATVDAMTGDTLRVFGYNASGSLVSIRDAGNNVTTIERDASSYPTAIVGPFGQRTTLTTDTDGYLRRMEAPQGEVVQLYHGAGGLLDSLVDPRGKRFRFQYDAVGRLIQDDDPAGGSQVLTRTATDTSYIVTLAKPNHRPLRYTVFADGSEAMRSIVTGADNLLTTTTWSLDGTTRVVTPDSVIMTQSVGGDPRFGLQSPVVRSASIRQPSGLTATINEVRRAVLVDSLNLFSVQSLVDSVGVNGKWAVSTFSRAAMRYTAVSPEGRQLFSTVDSLGRARVVRVPGMDSTIYRYDARGRLDRVQTGGRVAQYTYDTQGRLATATDPLGRIDSLFYDGANRLTRRVLPGGRTIQFAYDSSGNVTAITPPGRPGHGVSYTALDRDSLYSPPSLGAGSWATEYRYSLARQLTEIRRPDSTMIGFSYDSASRPSTVTFDRGQLGFNYSPTTGQLTSLTAPGGSTLNFAYDGALPRRATWVGPVAGEVEVAYNTDFRVTNQFVNGGQAAAFTYDRDGLLTSAGVLGLKRHAQTGFLERDSIGTLLGTWGYDVKGALVAYTASTSGTPVFQTSYVRDSLGRITQLTETVQGTSEVQAFLYDSAGRLAEVRRNGTLTASYTYDLNGNRLSLTTPNGTVTGSYDAQDRLTSYGSMTYGYTRAGTLRWKAVGSDTTWYTYDALGNLTAVTLPNGSAITYVIDGQNRRIGKKVNGVLVQGFLYQSQLAPVAELDGSGAVVSRFVYATRTNVPDYMVKDATTYRLVLDHLGSVRLVVNVATGAVAQRIDYDEFGRVTQNSALGFQPFGYAGGLLDDQTGLVRFGARDYDAVAGRWTARDPLGFNGGDANLYVYVRNDPLSYVDPDGQVPLPVAGAILGGIIGGGYSALGQYVATGQVNWGQVGTAALGGAIAGAMFPGMVPTYGNIGAGVLSSVYGSGIELAANVGLFGHTPTLGDLGSIAANALGGGIGARGFGRYADEFVGGYASRHLSDLFQRSDWHDFIAWSNLLRSMGAGSLSFLQSLLARSLCIR